MTEFCPEPLYIDDLVLRPIRHADYEGLLPFALNEPELWQYSLISAAGEEGLKHYIEQALLSGEKGTSLTYVVVGCDGSLVGSTRFYDFQPIHKTVNIGYTWYGKQYQGTGINKKLKFVLLQYAFEILQVERVEFRADLRNTRSINAMLSIGSTQEGILRSNCVAENGRRDSIILSILKSEWENELKSRLLYKIEAFRIKSVGYHATEDFNETKINLKN